MLVNRCDSVCFESEFSLPKLPFIAVFTLSSLRGILFFFIPTVSYISYFSPVFI